LSTVKITAVLRKASRRNIDVRAGDIQAALRATGLRQPGPVQAAFAAIAAGQVQVIVTLSGLATRYDKLALTYRGGVVLRAITIWLKELGDTP
jgi:hypothetical protein